MMSSKSTRKQLLIYGWARENVGSEVPSEVMEVCESYSLDKIQWTLQELHKMKQLSWNRTHNGPSMNVEGIKFELTVFSKEDPWKYGHKLSYFSLNVDKSSVLKSTLNFNVLVRVKGNIFTNNPEIENEQVEQPLFFNIGVNNMEQEIFSTPEIFSNKFKKIDLDFMIEITEIKHHKMNIYSSLKWDLNKGDIQKFNKSERYIYHKVGNWRVVLLDENGYKELKIKPISLPSGVVRLKCDYNLKINGKKWLTADRNRTVKEVVFETKGKEKNFNQYGVSVYEWPFCYAAELYTECEIIVEMTVVEIYDMYAEEIIDESKWSDYGFV